MRCLLVLAVFAACASAQLPPSLVPPPPDYTRPAPPPAPVKKYAITFEARTILVGRMSLDKWKTDWGSYDRDYVRMQHVELTLLRWQHGVECFAEILWFGRELGGEKRRVVFRNDAVKISPTATSILFKSGLVEGNVQNYVALAERYASGYKIEGWYVRTLDKDGRTLDDAASLDYLVTVARDPARLGALPVIHRMQVVPQ